MIVIPIEANKPIEFFDLFSSQDAEDRGFLPSETFIADGVSQKRPTMVGGAKL